MHNWTTIDFPHKFKNNFFALVTFKWYIINPERLTNLEINNKRKKALFNLEIKKKSKLSINPVIHYPRSGYMLEFITVLLNSSITINFRMTWVEWKVSGFIFYIPLEESVCIIKCIVAFMYYVVISIYWYINSIW